MKKLVARFSWSGIVVLLGGLVLHAATPSQHTKFVAYQDEGRNAIVDAAAIRGSSVKLTRDDEGISIKVTTTGLPAGAYTNWWVIFNPEDCDGACDGNGDAISAVLWATGGVVDRGGVGHFSARLDVGETRGPDQVFFLPGTLQDARKAGIMYVIKYHGPVDASIVDKQTTTSYGGCIGGADHPNDEEDPFFFCYDPQITPVLPGLE